MMWAGLIPALLLLGVGVDAQTNDLSLTAEPFKLDGLCTRYGHQSTIQEDTLYLHGGRQVRQTNRGVVNETNTDFLTLDLTQSFTTSSVPWKRINFPRSATLPPAVQQGALFNGNNSKLYLFEGQVPPTSPETATSEIWEFDTITQLWSGTTDNWQWTGSANGRNFPHRKSRGTPVEIPGTSQGFYIGGARAYENDTFKGWHYPETEQFVELDLEKGRINRESRGGTAFLPMKQKRIGPRAVHLPIGPAGVIVLLGGTEEHRSRLAAPPIGPSEDMDGIDPLEARVNNLSQLDTVWIYDLSTRTWHFQTTTGTPDSIPWARKNFCIGAISTPDKSQHHIFLFGGGTDYKVPFFSTADKPVAGTFVLTLPAFRWQVLSSSGSTPPPSQLQTCHTVGNQLLMFGGYGFNESDPNPTTCANQEMHIFDMASLSYTTTFQPAADAGPYKTPATITQDIGSGDSARSPAMGWDDTTLQHLFAGTTPDGSSADSAETTIAQMAAETRHAMIAAGLLGALAGVFMLSIIWIARKRHVETREMAVQLEHLKNLWRGGGGGGAGWTDGFEFRETVRDMNWWEKVGWRLGWRRDKTGFIADLGGYEGGERGDMYAARRGAVEAGWQGDEKWGRELPEKIP